MNPSTKAVLVAGGTYGAHWGYHKYREWRGSGIQGAYHKPEREVGLDKKDVKVPFAKTMIGQSLCATAAGWFQVYSGGIAIDTVATRLQAGQNTSQSLWGLSNPASDVRRVIERRARMQNIPRAVVATELLRRSNLFAGHFVTMLARFPYLFMNFNAYHQMDQFLERQRIANNDNSPKTLSEEMLCVTFATTISTTAITVAELPKIMDQVRSPNCAVKRTTVAGIIQEHGVARVFRGYTACFGREFLFNSALLLSPPLAMKLRDSYVTPNLESSPVARALQNNELLLTSMALGAMFGMVTNAPDQMKTNIQTGQFLNMREAWAWQAEHGGGIKGFFGKAAWWRGFYIMHAVVAINFAREKVENLITAEENNRATVSVTDGH